MTLCAPNCKHYEFFGFCNKYNENIHKTNGVCIHPLGRFRIYYNYSPFHDIKELIETADKCLTSNESKSIVKQYNTQGCISLKQQRLLVYQILHCYEP